MSKEVPQVAEQLRKARGGGGRSCGLAREVRREMSKKVEHVPIYDFYKPMEVWNERGNKDIHVQLGAHPLKCRSIR